MNRPHRCDREKRTGVSHGASLTGETRSQSLARFGSLRHRGTRIGFIPVGPVVPARSPAELDRATAMALAELAVGQDES